MEQLMRRIGGISETAYGESPGSIVTGKAVSRLQGVMTGMAAETQGCLEMSLSEVNRMAFKMWELYRPNKSYRLRSSPPGSSLSAPGRNKQPFSIEWVPEQDISGWYDNSLFYSPFGSDFATGLQTAMQMKGADLASDQWIIDQIPGMGDSVGMMKEIDENKRRRMKLEIDLQTEAQMQIMQAQQQMQMQQMQAEQQAAQGAAPGGGAPTGAAPGEPGNVPPEGAPGLQNTTVMPSGQPQVMGTGEPFTGGENFPLPFTNVQPFAEGLEAIKGAQGGPGATAQGEAMPGKTVVRAEEVVQALRDAVNRRGESALAKLKGKVYLIGDIATRGFTDGKIEFAITEKSDQQIVTNALPQYASQDMLSFRVVTSVPKGAIAITGGQNGKPQKA
jgi:hypothetical protein